MKGKKTGGRTAGIPNKDKPLKAMLREHSLRYFTPGPDGESDYDRDVAKLAPADRVDAELKLLRYHTAQMQATTVDIATTDAGATIEERLAALIGDK